MKKLLKVLLPPLSGFAVYFLMVRFNASYFSLRIDEMGEGSLRAFMAYYKYFFPLLFVMALLMQLLIINPLWRNFAPRKTYIKLLALLGFVVALMLFAGAVTYTITDANDSNHHIIMLFGFITLAQFFYWLIDFGVLLLLN